MTATKKKADVVFGAFVYHDEPDDAAANSLFVGVLPTVAIAAEAIRHALGAYWHYGSIYEGQVQVRTTEDGIDLSDFESDDRETPWQVGADYCERG